MDITALTPQPHFRLMLDLSLALIPLFIAFILFLPKYHKRSVIWWIGLIIFITFLPNAPYALTDYIHIVGDYYSYNKNMNFGIILIICGEYLIE
jgi:uncharacterized membrane protein